MGMIHTWWLYVVDFRGLYFNNILGTLDRTRARVNKKSWNMMGFLQGGPPVSIAVCFFLSHSVNLFFVFFSWLVVEPYPSEKYESQLGWLLQCEAPKISKLVYNSNVTMVYGTQITIVTGANLNQLTSLGGLTLYQYMEKEKMLQTTNQMIVSPYHWWDMSPKMKHLRDLRFGMFHHVATSLEWW